MQGMIRWDDPKLIRLGIPEANGQCANGSDAGVGACGPGLIPDNNVCSTFGEDASRRSHCATGFNAYVSCPNGQAVIPGQGIP